MGSTALLDILLVFGVFAAGAIIAFLGTRAIRKGNQYYHRTIRKKAIFEHLLGLSLPLKEYPGANLAISTTRGQEAIFEILHNPEAWLGSEKPKRGSVVGLGIRVLHILLWINVLAATGVLVKGAFFIKSAYGVPIIPPWHP